MKKSGSKSGPKVVFLHPSGPPARARLFGTFRLLNIKEREVYQKVWPVLGAHAGATKNAFLPDFGPYVFYKASFYKLLCHIGHQPLTSKRAFIDGCPLFVFRFH